MENSDGINTSRLKEYRLKLGLSYAELDRRAGLGGGTSQNAESGKGISVKTLKALGRALGVPSAIFLD